MQSTTIGVDLAKDVFEIAVSRFPGKVAEHRRLSRARFLRFFAQRQPSRILLEALRGARKGQFSIRINDQYRICFVWSESGPDEVEIVDYH